jgi:hypothetical protein
MLAHMLVQLPWLFVAGAIAAGPSPGRLTGWGWNQAGVAGLLAVTLTSMFWMLPIAIDHAVADPVWDTVKAASWLLAGATARASWRAAPSIVRVFFVGNIAWMTVVAGQLYEEMDVRLCNAYLLGDQAMTGAALSWATPIAVAAWALASNRTSSIRPGPDCA